MKVFSQNIKYTVYVALFLIFWCAPVDATCYGWNPGDIANINLQDKKSGYYRIWKDRKYLQLAAKLRHNAEIKVIKFIEGNCGGDVYIEATVKGRLVRGWTDSDSLVGLTR